MTEQEKEVLRTMFMNPRAPVANIALDKIEDEKVREVLRNLIRTIEAIYAGAAQASNYNMAKLVAQPNQPDVAEGESIVWHDTDAPQGAPMAFILTRVNGQVFRFPTDQISGGTTPPEPTIPTIVNIVPSSVSIDEGQQTTITVNLSGAAPVGGSAVAISSTDGGIAGVTPLTINIAEGQTSGTATVQGNNAGVCSIVASYNNSQQSCVVTVNDVVVPEPQPGADFLYTFENIQYGNIGFPILQFDKNLVDGDLLYRFQIQCKDTANPQNNVFQGSPARHGGSSIVLRTRGADTGVSGSGANERCDLNPTSGNPGGTEGQEFWWAHSIFLPAGFIFPGDPAPSFSHFHLLMQFHDNVGQPPIPIEIIRYRAGAGFPTYPMFRVRVSGGNPKTERLRVHLRNQEQVTANAWYDFVWHIIWSAGAGGRVQMWLRKDNESIGGLEINYTGPTMATDPVNMKPANYHSYVPGAGNNTDVYHDRIIRGHSAAQVSLFQLEGEPTF